MKKLTIILGLLCISGSLARTFTFKNQCNYTIWPGALGAAGHTIPNNGGWTLNSGDSSSLSVEDNWSGRFWGRSDCNFDNSGRGECATGDCGGVLQCNGAGGIPPATLAEFTLSGWSNEDFYDVSLVDGYNIPLKVYPDVSSCGTPGCISDLNDSCPAELQELSNSAVVACKSACEEFGLPQYCCTGAYSTP